MILVNVVNLVMLFLSPRALAHTRAREELRRNDLTTFTTFTGLLCASPRTPPRKWRSND
jgi:hypothetical protein